MVVSTGLRYFAEAAFKNAHLRNLDPAVSWQLRKISGVADV